MKEEMVSLKKHGAWALVPRPAGVSPIKARWVFKVKLDSNSKPIRYKARVVAKGFQQVYGLDYHETFAPVAKIKSMKLVLAIAAQFDLELKQLDFDTAFLNASLTEEVYMEQPDGFQIGGPNLVCKLLKALYGLKQAPYEWNQILHRFMITIGYKAIIADPCVYVKRFPSGRFIILCLYVHDTIAAYHKQDESIWLTDKKKIADQYQIKDLGDCEWILNMRVTRDRRLKQITLCQEAYVNRVLQQYNLDQCNSTINPEPIKDQSLPVDGTELVPLTEAQHSTYRSIVGALQYAASTTRVDIAHAVGTLSRHLATPAQHNLKAAKQCLRYLSGTANYGMIFSGNRSTPHSIIAYTDASWGNDLTDRKSTTGTIIKYNGNVISWLSKKQPTVATSTTEAEYMALGAAAKEALWYQYWIKEVFNVDTVPVIYGDNQSANCLSKNDLNHQRTKHIDITHHFLRDHVYNKRIDIQWIPTDKQQADLLTKALDTKQFSKLRDQLITKFYT